jgi:hypothetical protein
MATISPSTLPPVVGLPTFTFSPSQVINTSLKVTFEPTEKSPVLL